MVDRRTKARISFVTTLLVLPFRLYRWQRTRDDGAAEDAVPPELVAGFALHVAYSWAYDRDVCRLRTKRLRRGLAAGLIVGGYRRLAGADADLEAFSIGTSLGRLAYRGWYGVLRPLPGADA